MPVYACYRGDCANLAIDEANCFILQDALGNDWVCVETSSSEIPADPGAPVTDMLRAQGLAHKYGLSAEGSTIRMMVAADVKDLASRLILETYPSVEESAGRLRDAGWQDVREEFSTGRKFKVSVHNGQQTVEAEGDNAAEAWYRVAQKALQ